MATTKSTVLGIRLDHERRAWVEAEAERRGVSVRGLFEGMIDGARTGEASSGASHDVPSEADYDTSPAAVVEPPVASWESGVSGGPAYREPPITSADRDLAAARSGVNTSSSTFGASPWPDFGAVTALPGGVIRGAISLTTGLIKTSSRCASSRLESCPVMKHWSGRSA